MEMESLCADWNQCFTDFPVDHPSAEEVFCQALNQACFSLNNLVGRGFDDTNLPDEAAATLFYALLVAFLPLPKSPVRTYALLKGLRDQVNQIVMVPFSLF